MPAESSCAVFLSYASQDAAAVERIAVALRAAGVEVWFDQNELTGGDAWDAKIRGQIKACALFVPVISANTNARREGYFRREWKLAVDRTHDMDEALPFLLPVVIDGTTDAGAFVPEKFREVQWTRLVGGETPEKFSARVKTLLHGSAFSLPAPENPAVSRRGPTDHAAATPRSRWLLPAGFALALLFALAIWQPWRGTEKAASPSVPATTAAAPLTEAQPVAAKAHGSDKSAATDKSLVVLPLENLSPDPENAFFTDGMHIELINALSTVPNLKVISRPSSLRFKGSTATLAEIAQQVGVANVLTGSVRRADGKVKIQLELRRARDEALLLTKTYERELRDVIAIQTEVAGDIARALEIRESRGSFEWARYQSKNPEAYDLYLKAVQRYFAPWGQGRRYLEEAESCARDFQHVMDLDPGFAAAASFLSRAHTQAFSGSLDAAAAAEHARLGRKWAEEFARLMAGGGGDGALSLYYSNVEYKPARGLELAQNVIRALPNDAAGNYYMALALSRLDRRLESVDAFRRALELDPLNVTYWRDYTWTLVYLRRAESAAASMAQYQRLTAAKADPGLIHSWHYALQGELPAPETPGLGADWLFRLRRYEACVRACDANMANKAEGWELVSLALWRSDALVCLQRSDEAAQSARQALELIDGVKLVADSRVQAPHLRALALAVAGRIDEALEANARGAADLASTGHSIANFEIDRAEILARGHRNAECVELLQRLLRTPSSLLVPMLRLDPVWDNLRDDPGFQALLADPKNSAPL